MATVSATVEKDSCWGTQIDMHRAATKQAAMSATSALPNSKSCQDERSHCHKHSRQGLFCVFMRTSGSMMESGGISRCPRAECSTMVSSDKLPMPPSTSSALWKTGCECPSCSSEWQPTATRKTLTPAHCASVMHMVGAACTPCSTAWCAKNGSRPCDNLGLGDVDAVQSQ